MKLSVEFSHNLVMAAPVGEAGARRAFEAAPAAKERGPLIGDAVPAADTAPAAVPGPSNCAPPVVDLGVLVDLVGLVLGYLRWAEGVAALGTHILR